MRTPITVAIVGLEQSGPTLARVFGDLPGAEVRWLCDASQSVLLQARRRHPEARATADLAEVLACDAVDAVVVAAPPATHPDIVRRALEAQKHVLVEPPLAAGGEQAERLVALAEARDRRLQVLQPGLFHPALRKLKELVELDRLGETYYLSASHYELDGASTIWDLATADVAELFYLLDDEPVEVSAHGETYVRPDVVDVAFCYFRFATGITAHLHLSTLDRHSVRRLSVVGASRTAVFDEREPDAKLTVYQNGFVTRAGELGEAAAAAGADERLRQACEHFVSTVRGAADAGAARRAAAVAETLEALARSAAAGGAAVALRARQASEGRVVPLPLGTTKQ